jgi:hypothetical protein
VALLRVPRRDMPVHINSGRFLWLDNRKSKGTIFDPFIFRGESPSCAFHHSYLKLLCTHLNTLRSTTNTQQLHKEEKEKAIAKKLEA